MARILIIGLDGASPHLVQKWQSSLPNLSKLRKNGTHGTLYSVLPPRSIPAWYCFATGMNPAKLGVFGFSHRRPGTYDYTFANMTHCQAPPFWQWLNAYDYKTAVIHVPGTYPPQAVEGVLVSGWPGPVNRGNLTYTFPPELSRELDQKLGRPFEFLSSLPMQLDNDADVLADRLRLLQMHGDVAHTTLNETEWDVGVVVFSPVDRASHQFWRHMQPEHPAHDPALADQFQDALQKVYEEADAQVGRLLELLTAEDTVIIMSDHGFGPAYRIFYLNEWLKQQGYLVFKDDGRGHQSQSPHLLGKLAAPLFWLNNNSSFFRRLISPFKKRSLSNLVRDEYIKASKDGLVRLNHLPVDWQKTRAYCPDEGALYLNLKGRDPEGIIEPGEEAQALLAEIEAKLKQIPDPATGKSVPVKTYRKEAIYSGPFLEEAADLLIVMDEYTTEVMAECGSAELFVQAGARNGTHTMEGLFIANGPDITSRHDFKANLIDIAPTVLHLMETPIASESDGRVLFELFAKDSPPQKREIVTKDALAHNQSQSDEFTAEEAAQVEKQLRDLGYLN